MTGTKMRLAAYVIAWALVVGVGSAVAWSAIDRAGREATVLGDRPVVQPGSAAAIAATTSVPAPTPVPTTPAPPASTTPAQSPAATTSSRPAGGSRPTPTPPKTPSPTASAAPTPSVATVVGTQATAGGQLTVACRGTELSFVSASIADGWTYHRSSDPYPIEVNFQRGDIELEVTARCTNGSPTFSVR